MPGDSEENNDTENLEADFHQALINEHIVSNWVIVTYDSIPYICKVTASDEDNCVQVTVMTLQRNDLFNWPSVEDSTTDGPNNVFAVIDEPMKQPNPRHYAMTQRDWLIL